VASYEYLLAEELLMAAVVRATNAEEGYTALRNLGALQYKNGKQGEGSESFHKALQVFSRYPKESNNQQYVSITQATTHMGWIASAGSSDCQLSKQNLVV
jgi:hypothetical protein